MNFGDALASMQAEHKVRRRGWNGRNQWVCFMPPVTIAEGIVNGRTKKFVPEGDLKVGGYFVMWTEQGAWQPGWLASQADLLAEDWEIVR